jgi:hypothetical protein
MNCLKVNLIPPFEEIIANKKSSSLHSKQSQQYEIDIDIKRERKKCRKFMHSTPFIKK